MNTLNLLGENRNGVGLSYLSHESTVGRRAVIILICFARKTLMRSNIKVPITVCFSSEIVRMRLSAPTTSWSRLPLRTIIGRAFF